MVRMRIHVFLAVPLLSLLLCSCASSGRKFTVDRDQLQLGSFTRDQAATFFGKPDRYMTRATTNGLFEIDHYAYSELSFGTVATRVLFLEFKDGKLNGYSYGSSFDADKTKFDAFSLDKLNAGVGKLTKADVLAMEGAPDGKVRCPSSARDVAAKCSPGTEIWSWLMVGKVAVNHPQATTGQELLVSFGPDEKVSDVEMKENHLPGPR